MLWLHQRLSEPHSLDQTQARFESLRGHNLLPRGRENAAAKLTDVEIANAVLSFGHPNSSLGGHASLVLGNLFPVGGVTSTPYRTGSLRQVISELVAKSSDLTNFSRLTLSVQQEFGREEYRASIRLKGAECTEIITYVSKYALSLLQPGAEKDFDHEKLDQHTALERSLGPSFFRDLQRKVDLARHLNKPLQTDWREYQREEEKAEFQRKLGARPNSHFLNLRVDAQVPWPREPTPVNFGGHRIILFPPTKETSHSVSIDLSRERLSDEETRTLLNRLLSVMSWCADQPSSLHEGWSGNSFPSPIPKRNLAMVTMSAWEFDRRIPGDRELTRCLAYYRDGLNANSVGLASHAVLSFYRVFETRYSTRSKAIEWINEAFPTVQNFMNSSSLSEFELDREETGVDVGTYIYEKCRVATAHAARDVYSDPDEAKELRRLLNAAEIIRRLAQLFIEKKFSYSKSYFFENEPTETAEGLSSSQNDNEN